MASVLLVLAVEPRPALFNFSIPFESAPIVGRAPIPELQVPLGLRLRAPAVFLPAVFGTSFRGEETGDLEMKGNEKQQSRRGRVGYPPVASRRIDPFRGGKERVKGINLLMPKLPSSATFAGQFWIVWL